MKHLKTISQSTPALAQFDPIYQFILVVQSLLGLFQQISDMFGIPIPQKGDDTGGDSR